jgi:hypothetical protein
MMKKNEKIMNEDEKKEILSVANVIKLFTVVIHDAS